MTVAQQRLRQRALLALATLLWSNASPAFAAYPPLPGGMSRDARLEGACLCQVALARDFTLSFEHHLGTAEAKRRVAARLDALRDKFAGTVSSSTITWTGNTAEVRVSVFGQTAAAWVPVGEDYVQIHVHLPLLLTPLSGRIESFLSKTASGALKR